MKLVIDIPEEQYLLIRHYQDIAPNKTHSLAMSIINGTPLPKGHGRLIDADALWKKWVFDAIGKQEIDEAPTIIEADKESDEQEEIDDYRDILDELEREEYYESKYGKEKD